CRRPPVVVGWAGAKVLAVGRSSPPVATPSRFDPSPASGDQPATDEGWVVMQGTRVPSAWGVLQTRGRPRAKEREDEPAGCNSRPSDRRNNTLRRPQGAGCNTLASRVRNVR